MNTKKLVASNCIVIILFIFPSLFASGQDSITTIPTLHSYNSVVREIENGITLTFADTWENNLPHIFIFYPENTTTALVADFSNEYTINDMEIVGGMVYFCGNKTDTAMFGYFDINDVFFNNGSIHFCTIPFNNNNLIKDIKKMEILQLNNGIHLIMTGEGLSYSSKKAPIHHWFILDVYKVNTAPSWTITYAYDNNHYLAFDDVAVTASAVITTAHALNTNTTCKNMYAYLYFQHPTSATTNIFAPYQLPSTPSLIASVPEYYTCNLISCSDTTGQVLIEHLKNNAFATICQIYNDQGVYNSMLTIYMGIGNPLYRALFKPIKLFNYKEIKANSNYGVIYLLNQGSPTIFYKQKIDPTTLLPYSPLVALTYAHYPLHWTSLDASNYNSSAIISGAEQNMDKMFWRHGIQTILAQPCARSSNIPLSDIPPTENNTYIILNYIDYLINDSTITPLIHPESVRHFCP